MSEFVIIEIPLAGQVKFRKSSKAVRINITVKPQHGAVVAVPNGCSMESAIKFAESKALWIKKAIDKMAEIEKNKTLFTPQSDFSTKFRKLKMQSEDRKNIKLNINESFIEILYPQNYAVENENLQAAIKKAIEHAWKIEAFEYLPQRMAQISKEKGLQYKTLNIKNTKSSWGKCFANNNITLSIHLMHLPNELIDYVILHELCHTVHKNHGKGFWALLDKLSGGQAKALDKKIKLHSTVIY